MKTVIFETLNTFVAGYFDEVIISVIIVVAIVALRIAIGYFLNRMASSVNMSKPQLKTIVSIINILLIVVAATIIVFQFSATTGIIASAISLSAGTIIGFASINTVGNAIAGILLIIARPFKMGDRIRIGGPDPLFGDVLEITLLYTKVKTIHSELVSVPNQILVQQEIINYSGLDSVAIVVYVSMGYSSDRRKIESLLLESARKVDRIINVPEPYVLMSDFANFSAVYELRAYTDMPNEYYRVQSEVRKVIYDVFIENGLDLSTANIIISSTMDEKHGNRLEEGS